MQLDKIIEQSRGGGFGLKKLNFILSKAIPFNKPHRIKLIKTEPEEVQAIIPYRRSNLNHIKGIHACGMATACEFASGFLLLDRLGMKDYRLIMESLEMKYHYQAKGDAIATFKMTEEDVNSKVLEPLKTEEKVYIRCQIECHDREGNHLCTGVTNWQVKAWSKVKTKLA